ncbi:hypothetical protein AQUCO_01700340v1 [Aquilegia coerulea]|uniref:Cytochrome c oxidase subunit n=1 Tax=Aquilegia coerulea TaxID=218851 RepID=A0A2G5DMC7_AQUCA|nr:hypothetical protein AQUCO_03400190v1 [Aquilegia coerulea]PIA44670.1 hypothetical protein AQUCO_01700340v1 [Aquilegia coerulea]
MAEVESKKTLTLAEQYSLPQKEQKLDKAELPVETVPKTPAPEDVVTEKIVETPQESVTTDVTPEASPEEVVTEAEQTQEAPPTEEKEAPPAEESSAPPENEESGDQEDAEEKPEIKLETAPADFRFPTTNQSRHCFTRYIEYHRCIAAKGDGAPECDKFAKYYRSLCPGEWVDKWNEQRENGTFPGPL